MLTTDCSRTHNFINVLFGNLVETLKITSKAVILIRGNYGFQGHLTMSADNFVPNWGCYWYLLGRGKNADKHFTQATPHNK